MEKQASLEETLLPRSPECKEGEESLAVSEEVKRQLWLAGPLIAGCLMQNLIQMISVMFVGHLGELPLAGASMASSFAAVTGFSLLDWNVSPSDPPAVGSTEYVQGLALDGTSEEKGNISVSTAHSDDDAEDSAPVDDPKTSKKRTREVEEESSDESTSSEAKRQDREKVHDVAPLTYRPPPPFCSTDLAATTSSAPITRPPRRLFSLGIQSTSHPAPSTAPKGKEPSEPSTSTAPPTTATPKETAPPATAMGSVPESSKDAGETALESSHSGAEANKASTSSSKNLLEELDLSGLAVDTLADDFQPFVRIMAEISKQYLGMARQRDTTRVNLSAAKEHLNEVSVARDLASARVSELEKQIAALQKECAAAKQEAMTALDRAVQAETREKDAMQ